SVVVCGTFPLALRLHIKARTHGVVTHAEFRPHRVKACPFARIAETISYLVPVVGHAFFTAREEEPFADGWQVRHWEKLHAVRSPAFLSLLRLPCHAIDSVQRRIAFKKIGVLLHLDHPCLL